MNAVYSHYLIRGSSILRVVKTEHISGVFRIGLGWVREIEIEICWFLDCHKVVG